MRRLVTLEGEWGMSLGSPDARKADRSMPGVQDHDYTTDVPLDVPDMSHITRNTVLPYAEYVQPKECRQRIEAVHHKVCVESIEQFEERACLRDEVGNRSR